ncbi:MAG: hypothetical protein K1X78_27250 [Verrucomicrobiaceae bacterium]|nr:hypothetical protein [Verrucomicrobiaceae bacterium]
MKTNRKLQLLAAATVAMLAINPTARAQTPAPLSDEMLLHALATGQVGFTNDDMTFTDYIFTGLNSGAPSASQIGVGGGNDDRVANSGTASAVTSYGGGLYLQGQPTANYGGAMYYGGAIYNATTSAPPVNSWYNDFYGNVSAPNPNSGFLDTDGSTADLHATTTSTYGGGLYLQGQPTASYGGAIYNTTAGASSVISIGGACDLAPALQSNGPMTVNYGGAAYLQSQPTALYGGAIYHATGSSLYGEDFPGEALVGEELPGEALWGEDLPGEALTDAQLDALILNVLAGVCDEADNCLTAPMPR